MKCKNWSNKINNFVVRKLKSFKINGQQQTIATTTTSTMPAMPKEKSSPIPLMDSNFSEIKEQDTMTSVVTTKLFGCTKQSQQQQQSQLLLSDETTVIISNGQQLTGVAATTSNLINHQIDNNKSSSSQYQHQQQQQNHNHYQQHNNNHTNNCNYQNMNKIQNSTSSITTTTTTAATTTTGTTSVSSTTTTISGLLQQQNYDTVDAAISCRQQQQQSPTIQQNNGVTITSATSQRISTNLGGKQQQHQQQPNSIPAKKSPNDFVFGKYIGEGSFSTVYLARDIHTNREYAIKVCDKHHILREKKQEYIRREREVMHNMNNVPGFVNLSCTFQDYRSLYFVMTYAKNGDLLPYINKVGSFDLDCTRHYAAELVLAIENMHKRNIVHRDLKPENILLDENMHTLIADFGSAKILTPQQQQQQHQQQQQQQQQQQEDTNKDTTTTTTTATTILSTKSINNTSSNNKRENDNNIKNHVIGDANHDNDNDNDHDDDDDVDDDDDDSSDEMNYREKYNLRKQQPIQRKRKGSFVGTAQYVSPEVLQGDTITKSADLWALGCIIYQMISGLPPFRGGSDYLIFKEIMNLSLVFPEGFDKNAEDLVRNLLKIHPIERIGAQDKSGRYESIRTHPFFDDINWDCIRIMKPPTIYPYLPGVHKDEELRSHYRVPDNLEPGLDDKQLTRLLGLELGTVSGVELEKKTEPKNNLNITEIDKQKRLEAQKSDKWNTFSDGEIILKKGFINKRKGLFARKRMLLLTTGPRLIYIDPFQMVKKGEIPWSPELRVEPKNFKIFFVHTPNRTYYLEDPEGYALEWVNAIEDVRQKTYGDKS